MVSVFDYTDYRCFLKDGFSEHKKKTPSFSFRSFNRIAGIKSSGFLKLVMDGKRNLAEEGIQKVARGFRLREEEQVYFKLLVKFNQAKDHLEKDRIFRELSQNKKFTEAKPLTAAQYRLFSHWFYVAILELVRVETTEKKNVHWLCRRINPMVTYKEVRTAVDELIQLNLLKEISDGTLQRRDEKITTEDEVHSVSVANFHVQMSKLAARAVQKERAQDREFSSLTVVTSEESFQRAKEEIQKFRKRLHSILEQESHQPKTIVSQINMQLFKLSKGA